MGEGATQVPTRGRGRATTRACELEQAPASGAETARWAYAQGALTIGQQVRTNARDALQHLRKLVEQWFAQGHRYEHILKVLRPA
jgi:hypothetical protein